jgi:hypothetical protein
MLRTMTRNHYRVLGAIAALIAVVLIAMPALGVDPSGSPSAGATESSAPASTEPSAAASEEPSAAASAKPSASGSAGAPAPAPAASGEATEPDEDGQGDNHGKPDKAGKHDAKTPEHPVTLKGIVGRSSGEDGEFTLVVGLKVYRLSAGPRWWWGDSSPLAAVVGKVVTIDGEQEDGSDEVDVLAIDGKQIRAPGRPPWAGGWKVVGSRHPGWAQWKVNKAAAKDHGRNSAPGQLKHEDEAPSPSP